MIKLKGGHRLRKEIYRYALGIALAGIVLLFFGYQYLLGYWLGCIGAFILMYRTETFWNEILDQGESTKFTGVFHWLINYGIMAILLVISAKFPQYFNVITCAIGLMLVKFAAILDSIVDRHLGRKKV